MTDLRALKKRIADIPWLGAIFIKCYQPLKRLFTNYDERIVQFEQRINALENSLNQRQAQLKVDVARALTNKQDRTLKVAEPYQPSALTADMEKFYDAFEDHFRASPAELKKHFENFYPFLNGLSQRFNVAALDVLDIGCGRGEWLSVLNASGHRPEGIDLNQLSVEQCRLNGLDAHQGDAVKWLNENQQKKYHLITGFHIVEHLPFEQLIELFDAVLQALEPGGLVIFETPNPENLTVSGYSFYLDPTHLHPIPPLTLRFMAEQRGFKNCEIHRFNPREEVSESLPLTKRWFANAVDYALIGEK